MKNISDRDYFWEWIYAAFFDTLYWFCRGGNRPVRVQFVTKYAKGEEIMLTLAENQKVSVKLEALDIKGRPAQIDGVPVWNNSNPGAVDLALTDDQMGGTILYLDGGDAQITATVDVRLGPEVKNLVATADIHCLPMEATTVTLTLGVPEPINP